jgi:hypothetical protein
MSTRPAISAHAAPDLVRAIRPEIIAYGIVNEAELDADQSLPSAGVKSITRVLAVS